jgi:hypothetical protein
MNRNLRTVKEIAAERMQTEPITTDTPLTDAARQKYYDGTLSEWVHYKIAMMLEHELAESREEVEGLRKLIEQLFDATEPACDETCKCSWRLLEREYSQILATLNPPDK